MSTASTSTQYSSYTTPTITQEQDDSSLTTITADQSNENVKDQGNTPDYQQALSLPLPPSETESVRMRNVTDSMDTIELSYHTIIGSLINNRGLISNTQISTECSNRPESTSRLQTMKCCTDQQGT